MTQRLENEGLLTQKCNEASILHLRRKGLREQLYRLSNPYLAFSLFNADLALSTAQDLKTTDDQFQEVHAQIERLCEELGKPIQKFT